MDFKLARIAAAAVVLSAVAEYFGSGLNPIWWLTWWAPLPVLLVATKLSRVAAFLTAVLAWSLGALNMWSFFHTSLEIPLPIVLTATLGPPIIFGLGVLMWREMIRRGRLWRAAIVLPSFSVSCAYVYSTLSPHSTSGNAAYSQMDFLPILQLASLTGVWGISFCLLLVPTVTATLATSTAPRQQKRALATAATVLLLAAGGFGVARLNLAAAPQSTITVGLASEDHPAEKSRVLDDYATMADQLATQGAQLIVLPEKIARVSDSEIGQVDAIFGQVASKCHAGIVVGLTHKTPHALLNEARMYSPAGKLEANYEKHHMLPAFESDMLVGTQRTVLLKPPATWGIAICKDMDFPLLSRQYGQDGVGLMLVPAWDFSRDGWLHGRMAVLRGVESGFSMARAARQGRLTVTDDRGRVLAERNTASAPFASLVAEVPVRHDATLFARWGDWFAWLNIGMFALVILYRR